MDLSNPPAGPLAGNLLSDIRALIDSARGHVAQSVNAGLVRLYWSVGRRIRRELLKDKRAEYGQKIPQTLSGKLTRECGRGFGQQNLLNMIRFAAVFPDCEIVQTMSAKLGWSHFVELLFITDPPKRDFYAEDVPLGALESGGIPANKPEVCDGLITGSSWWVRFLGGGRAMRGMEFMVSD